MVVFNLLLANLVKFFFLTKLFFKTALKGFSSSRSKMFLIYGNTKNLKQAADEIGLPGKPKNAFCLPFIFANKIGFPGLIATPLK